MAEPSQHGTSDLALLREAINRLIPSVVLMDLSHYPRTVTDTNGVILYANPAFSAMTGYPLEETVGLSHRAFNSGFHPSFYFSEVWHTLLVRKEVWHGEFRNKRKDGSLYWAETEIIPVLDKGEVVFFLAEMKDITARKRVEEERETALRANQRAVQNARMLQRQIITERLPVVPGYDLSALYIPSEIMSGDIFIVREHMGKLAVLVADCTGHGVEASMNANLMWRTLVNFDSLLHESTPRVADFLSAVNRRLCEVRTEETGYPTLLVGVFDLETHRLTCGRAGGLSPIVFSGTELKPFPVPPGLVLAVDESAQYQVAQMDLVPGDSVAFLSDALIEERERKGKKSILGSDAFLAHMLKGYPSGGHVENIRYLFTQLADVPKVSPLSDDATMILVKVLTAEEVSRGDGKRHTHTLFL